MIALLGPPPSSLLARANLKSKFFSEEGEWQPSSSTRGGWFFYNTNVSKGNFSAGIPLPHSRTLEDRETTLKNGEDEEERECFLRLMRKMLQWEPEKRSSPRELAEDDWIVKHTTDT
jgi:serine/threonine-protein kinase SRPK3